MRPLLNLAQHETYVSTNQYLSLLHYSHLFCLSVLCCIIQSDRHWKSDLSLIGEASRLENRQPMEKRLPFDSRSHKNILG